MTSIYLNPIPPMSYRCGMCGAHNVKLWRDYMTFLNDLTLLCARCAALKNEVDITSIDDGGSFKIDLGKTDQIGDLVPAILTEDNTSYWGYTSVPLIAVNWWKNIPTLTFPKEKR